MKHLFSLILIFYSFVFAYGQEPKFRHLDVSDGLPSSTVYQVFQDSKGYIWFSTEAGLTRFDGTYIENFTTDDGLADNEIFGLFEDSKNRIWMRAYNGKYAYFQDGYIYNEEDADFIREMKSAYWATNISEDSEGNVYFSLGKGGLIILTNEDEVIKINIKTLQKQFDNFLKKNKLTVSDYKVSVAGIHEEADGNIHILTSIGEFLINNQTYKPHFVHRFINEVSQIHFVNDTTILGTDTKEKKKIFWHTDDDFLPIFSQQDIKARSIIPFSLNTKGQLWLGTLGDGVFLIDDFLTKPTIKNHYLEGKAVSYFIEDTEGNLWFSTLGEGIYMLAKNTVLTYTMKQGLASNDLYAITGNEKGQIYVGNKEGAVNVIDEKGDIRLKTADNLVAQGYDRITDILVNKNQELWVSSDIGLTVFGRNIRFNQGTIKSMSQDKSGNVFIASSNGVYEILKNGTNKEIWDRRTAALSPNDDGTLWIGSNSGLYFYNKTEVLSKKGESPLLTNRISDLEQTSDGILCICSANGVVLKKDNQINHLTKSDGLAGNVCKDLFIDKEDNTVWMASNTGISQFQINPETLEISYIVNYSEEGNLASNDIRKIYANKQKVWMATSKGLSFFDAKVQKEVNVAPPIYINNIKIWERDTSIHKSYQLKYNQANITIGYTGISFQSGNQIRYEYMMEGIDKDWISTYITEAKYPDLQPGTYTFKVKAIAINQLESETTATIQFTICPPWWATWWFRLFSVLAIGAISYFVVNYTIQNRKQKEQLRRQIVESEQMALRAQMNPHFVFNALNSIQHFITMEDEMSANYYLTRFSKLIRRVLENSKHSFITIHEEVETLQLYLELEMLRFEGKFNYKIDVDDEIDDYDTEIPSMVIQPFLENAIWHGLMAKQGDSELDIQFEQAENFIICRVKDNGVGRKASAKANKGRTEEHKSTGIANTVKRLGLLSNVKGETNLMEIIDLEEDGIALGTLVILKIPFR